MVSGNAEQSLDEFGWMTKERNGLDSGKKDKLGKRLPKKKKSRF